jgi:hypothetical protein
MPLLFSFIVTCCNISTIDIVNKIVVDLQNIMANKIKEYYTQLIT